MRVRALRLGWDGFALKRRRPGEVFEFPDKHIRTKDKDGKTIPAVLPRWVERVDGKPAAARPSAPTSGRPGLPPPPPVGDEGAESEGGDGAI